MCPFEKCKFIHDIEKYLSDKPADVGKTCYIYSTKGFCPRGLTCRFASAHIDGDLNNLKSDKYNELAPKTTLNQISFGNLLDLALKECNNWRFLLLYRVAGAVAQKDIQFRKV